jgi:stage III sporulation protein SpoIIIAA
MLPAAREERVNDPDLPGKERDGLVGVGKHVVGLTRTCVRNRWLARSLAFITRPSRLSSGLMGSNQSKTSARRIVPDVQFRVLVLGRANAGKTTILQRVCETTESPKIYRGGEEVRHVCPNFYSEV